MVENSSYLQNKNWLRKVFKYYLLHAVAPDYRIESLRDYPYSRSSCPFRGLQLVRIMPSPRIMVSKLDDSVLDRDLSIPLRENLCLVAGCSFYEG